MYTHEFAYHRASSLADAQRLLGRSPGAKLLAGGHSLLPLLKLRLAAPAALIDIGHLSELRGITVDGDTIRIGALTTHAEIAASAALGKSAAALAEAAAHVGDPAVRNRGTIGGNIAHADPASDLPIVLVALGAQISVSGPQGERVIAADAFFTGMMTTALAEGDIVTAVHVPMARAGQGSAYEKFAHPASRYAVIGVAALVEVEGNECRSARVAIGGLVPHARRAGAVEAALVGGDSGEAAVQHAAVRVANDFSDDLTGDVFASAEYRAAVAPVYVERALAAAIARARAA